MNKVYLFFYNKGAILSLQLILFFFYFKTNDYAFLFGYLAIGVIYILYFLRSNYNKNLFINISSLFVLFLIFSSLSRENSILMGGYNLLLGVISFFSAYFLYHVRNSYQYIRILFWMFSLFLLYNIFDLGIDNPDLYNDIFTKGSRNIVSALYIFLLLLFYLVASRDEKNISIVYPITTFIGCIFLYGRAGIIVSLLILVYALVTKKKWEKFEFLFVSFVLIMLVLYHKEIINFLEYRTSFVYGMKTGRTTMWREYFSGINIYDVLFGRELNCCESIRRIAGNPHNSFIAGHIRFGIIHTIFSIVAYLYILSSRNINYIFIASIIYLRIGLDQLALFSPLDIVLFYMIIDVYFHKSSKFIRIDYK